MNDYTRCVRFAEAPMRKQGDIAASIPKQPAISPGLPPGGLYEKANPRLTAGGASRR